MARGGPARRAKLSEASLRKRYALNGIPRGTVVAACFDKYGRWELGYHTGTIVQRGTGVYVQWDDWDQGDLERFEEGDARYLVDREKWRLYVPPAGSGDPMNALNMRVKDALTSAAGDGRIASSPQKQRTTEEDENMSDGVEDEKTYSAKQVATRIGTDAKTLRKFFRTHSSLVEAVGQGGRYEFAGEDIPRIKEEFDSWKSSSSRGAKKKVEEVAPEVLEEAEEEFEGLEDPEPSDEELEEIGDVDDLMEILDDEEE